MSAVIFDLDGTLIDSAPDIRAAVNAMLAELDMAPLDLPKIVSFIGNGLPRLVELVIADQGLSMEQHAHLTARVLAHYHSDGSALTKPYDGVMDVLTGLRAQGIKIGLCTNKPYSATMDVLNDLNMGDMFDVIVGGDSLPERKPHPAPLQKVIADLGSTDVIYVGDSEVDAATAEAAKVRFALFTQGYRKTPVDQLPHDVTFDHFDALPRLIADMLGAAAA